MKKNKKYSKKQLETIRKIINTEYLLENEEFRKTQKHFIFRADLDYTSFVRGFKSGVNYMGEQIRSVME